MSELACEQAGERARRGEEPERLFLDSSQAGKFAESGEAHWRISSIGAGHQLQ